MASESGVAFKRMHRACLNCRRKKVRCYGEQPECSYCARLGQHCRYPDPPLECPAKDPSATPSSTPAKVKPDKHYDALVSRISLLESQLAAMNGTSTAASTIIAPCTAADDTAEWTASTDHDHTTSSMDFETQFFSFAEKSRATTEVLSLPPLQIQMAAIDAYFRCSHNQPYCFFHEETFRAHFANGILPEYLMFAVLAIAMRFFPRRSNGDAIFAERYASQAWKAIVSQSFDSDNGPSYRLVQATCLLALFDYTACKHGTAWIKSGLAVSMAQALQMTEEPSLNLSCAAREERRRTLWSIYLFDKLATCGRRRPPLFSDSTCSLQLPCSDYTFKTSTIETVPTLDEFENSDDLSLYTIDSFARTVVVASSLSFVTRYVLHQPRRIKQYLPWHHQSEYPAICTQLNRLEIMFECFQPVQAWINTSLSSGEADAARLTNTFLFSYVLYQLCHCLLSHPFLLHLKVNGMSTRMPQSFLIRSLENSRSHAMELVAALNHAQQAGLDLNTSFYGYCLMVAGTIHVLFQNSANETIRRESLQAVEQTLAMIGELAKCWKNSALIRAALKQFAADSPSYAELINTSAETIDMSSMDTERLFSLLDYGEMSNTQNFGAPDLDLDRYFMPNMTNVLPYNDPVFAMDSQGFGFYPSMGHLQASKDGSLECVSPI